MEHMKKVAILLQQIRNTSSTNDKKKLLEKGLQSDFKETMQRVLEYTLNPFKMYGLTEQTLDKTVPNEMTFTRPNETSVFTTLDILAENNINDHYRTLAKSLLMAIEDEQVREMVQMIMVKDLKAGIASTTVNKIVKGLIPEFKVQLAESFSKQKDGALNNKTVWITEKLDGFRCVYNPIKNEFYTRQGQVYEGLRHLKESCMLLCQQLQQASNLKELPILDGELLHKKVEGLNSQELYNLTTKVARKKGEHKDKLNLEFNVFDFVPVDEFQVGTTVLPYSIRRETMDKVFALWSFQGIVPVKTLYSGVFNEQVLMELLEEVESKGQEGLMINLDKPYECKRSKGLLKVKTFKVADVYVKSIHEGTGRLENKLGNICIQYSCNGEIHECDLGSGFSDTERIEYWNNQDLLVGKVVEAQFFEVTKNANGDYGLRFPVWLGRIRNDKGFEDISDVLEL